MMMHHSYQKQLLLTTFHQRHATRAYHPQTMLRSVRLALLMSLWWMNREVTWVAAEALRAQNPWIFVSYVQNRKLQKHPDFAWVQPLTQQAEAIKNLGSGLQCT